MTTPDDRSKISELDVGVLDDDVADVVSEAQAKVQDENVMEVRDTDDDGSGKIEIRNDGPPRPVTDEGKFDRTQPQPIDHLGESGRYDNITSHPLQDRTPSEAEQLAHELDVKATMVVEGSDRINPREPADIMAGMESDPSFETQIEHGTVGENMEPDYLENVAERMEQAEPGDNDGDIDGVSGTNVIDNGAEDVGDGNSDEGPDRDQVEGTDSSGNEEDGDTSSIYQNQEDTDGDDDNG